MKTVLVRLCVEAPDSQIVALFAPHRGFSTARAFLVWSGSCLEESMLSLRENVKDMSSLAPFNLLQEHGITFQGMQYFPALPPSCYPCTILMPLSVVTNFSAQSVTVSEFWNNWQVLVSQAWNACLCCRSHWAVKLGRRITSGSVMGRRAQSDGWWRSKKKKKDAFMELSMTGWGRLTHRDIYSSKLFLNDCVHLLVYKTALLCMCQYTGLYMRCI